MKMKCFHYQQIFTLMFNILKNYMNFIIIYHFYQKIIKIVNVEKLVARVHNINEYVIHRRNLNQPLNHHIILKKVYKGIRFNQNLCLKPYIDMNSDLRKKAKNDFEKEFFKLVNNGIFCKSMENAEKIEILNLSQQK